MNAWLAMVGTSRGLAYSRSIRSRALRKYVSRAMSSGVMPRAYLGTPVTSMVPDAVPSPPRQAHRPLLAAGPRLERLGDQGADHFGPVREDDDVDPAVEFHQRLGGIIVDLPGGSEGNGADVPW